MIGKFNCFKFVWQVGLFASLILILLLVLKYKIYYEDRPTYFYFYECETGVCGSNSEEKVSGTVYSKLYYKEEIPTIEKVLDDTYLVLSGKRLFNYKEGLVISNEYDDYEVLFDEFIVKRNDLYGLLNKNNNLIIDVSYDELTSYDNVNYVVRKGNIYSLINKASEVILSDYDYIYAYNDDVVVIKDGKLNVVDLSNKKLLKNDLNVYNGSGDRMVDVFVEDGFIKIKIFEKDDYYLYKYDVSANKIWQVTDEE